MIPLPHEFKEFLRLLAVHRVEYLLVGGHAVAIHGYPRVTGDMDLWIARLPANAPRIRTVLRAFGFDDAGLADQTFLQEDQILRIGYPPLRIEIMTSLSGVDFTQRYSKRTMVQVGDLDIPVIGLPDLKANKQAAGRLKDLSDLENLP